MKSAPRPELARRSAPSLAVVWLLSLFVGLVAISHQSLWIDEGNSALKAVQPTLSAWWKTLVQEGGSDLQMPLYMAYLWAWEKVVGHSEFGLRLANLPWLIIAVMAARWGLAGRTGRFWIFLALCVTSPFVWSYLDEARPYIMLLAGAGCALAGLWRMLDHLAEVSSLRLMFSGVFIICAANMIAVPWGIGFLLGAVALYGPRALFRVILRIRYSFMLFAGGLIVLAGFYLWTLKLGTHATNVGKTEFVNLVFVLYEQLGFGGLGPSRLALRETGWHALGGFAMVLSVAAVLLAPWMVEGLFAAMNVGKRHRRLIWLVVVFPIVSVLTAGLVAHVRILGRHLIPLLPFIWFGLALGWERMIRNRERVFQLLGIVWVVSMLISSLEIRFARRHRKDDYRSAAAEAQQAAAQGPVWWAADENTGKYYGLSFAQAPKNNFRVQALMNPDEQQLRQLPEPDLIVLSKPDIYDAQHTILTYAQRNGFTKNKTLPAFEIWKKQPLSREHS